MSVTCAGFAALWALVVGVADGLSWCACWVAEGVVCPRVASALLSNIMMAAGANDCSLYDRGPWWSVTLVRMLQIVAHLASLPCNKSFNIQNF